MCNAWAAPPKTPIRRWSPSLPRRAKGAAGPYLPDFGEHRARKKDEDDGVGATAFRSCIFSLARNRRRDVGAAALPLRRHL